MNKKNRSKQFESAQLAQTNKTHKTFFHLSKRLTLNSNLVLVLRKGRREDQKSLCTHTNIQQVDALDCIFHLLALQKCSMNREERERIVHLMETKKEQVILKSKDETTKYISSSKALDLCLLNEL